MAINNNNFALNNDYNNAINNYSIEKFINIYDNFGHDITIIRDGIINFEILKQAICNEMKIVWNINYHPENLRLFKSNNDEIVNLDDIANIDNIRIIVIPMICNAHLG